MATTTTNYAFPKYEATDKPDLTAGYNSAMDKIDATLASLVAGQVRLPAGFDAFLAALGLTSDNAAAVGEALNKLVNRTPSATNATFTAADLAKVQKTDSGLLFIPTGA